VPIKLHREEIKKLREHSDKPLHDMSEEELLAAMEELGIEKRQFDPQDQEVADKANKTTKEDLELLEKLTQMNYSGLITDEEYEAKKKQILGL
jgi:hypothetical protein